MSIASQISTVNVYVLSLTIGAIFGLFLRTALDQENRDKLYESLADLSIGILLPIHVFFTIISARSLETASYFGPLFIAGPACSAMILIVTHFISKRAGFGHYHPHFKYISSTFGGGGRAVVLLAALVPFIEFLYPSAALQGGLALDFLAFFDVGYWLVYTTLIFPVMKLSFNQTKAAAKPGYGWQSLSVVLAAALATIAQLLDVQLAQLIGREVISVTRWILTSGIVAFSAAALVLKTGNWRLQVVARGMVFIFAMRVLGLAIPILVVILFYQSIALYFFIPMLLMALCPPSSYVDRMLFVSGANDEQVREAANINLSWNLLLIALAVLCIAGYGASSFLFR